MGGARQPAASRHYQPPRHHLVTPINSFRPAMIMFAISSSPSKPESAYSSPSGSYVFADSVRKAPLRSRSTIVRDVGTQTDPKHGCLQKIAYRLAFLCDEFEKEFSDEPQDSPSSCSFSEALWKWIL